MQSLEIRALHLKKAIKDIAPKMTSALKTYHTYRDKHSALVTEHREVQKQLKILNGGVKFITITKRQTNTSKPAPKVDVKKTISHMSDEEKKALRELLLGDGGIL